MPPGCQNMRNDCGIVKVVDFQPFMDGSNKQTVADTLIESLKTIGFVCLVNHGLCRQKIDKMFEMVCQ